MYYFSNGVNPDMASHSLLLIHGAWHTSKYWEKLMNGLAENQIYAIAVDLPSHGNSAGDKSIRWYSITNYANAIAEFITEQGNHNLIPVGHSMGGAIVLRLLQKQQDITKAILLAPANRRGVANLFLRLFWSYPLTYLKSICTLNLYPFVKDIDRAFELFYSDQVTKKEVQPYLEILQNESFRAAINMLFKQPKPKNVEFMIIAGTKDTIFPHQNIEHFSSKMNVNPYIIEGGHNIHVEAPDKCVELITSWV